MFVKTKEYLDKATSAFGAKLYEEALEACVLATVFEPDLAPAWCMKGHACLALDCHEEALEAYVRASDLDPNLFPAWNGRGDVSLARGRYQEALAAYDEALRLDPKSAVCWNGKGLACKALGLHEEAVQALDGATRLSPDSAALWNTKGHVLKLLRRYEEALNSFRQASDLDPDTANPWNGIGNVYLAQGLHDEALAAYFNAARLNPRLANPWNNIGIIHASSGRHQEALEAFGQAVSLDPSFARAWNGKGRVHLTLGNHEEARRAFDEAIWIDPGFAEPWYHRSVVSRMTGYALEADRCLYRFYHLANNDQDILANKLFALTEHFGVSAPFFAARILAQRPLSEGNETVLHEEISKRCHRSQDLVRYLQRPRSGLGTVEACKLEGLVAYYAGDPMQAATFFDRVDTEDDTDLMGQYYFILSMRAYLEDTTDELQFALGQAAAQHDSSFANRQVADSYYAGHLFMLNGDYGRARACFENSGDFLPAQYMAMRTYDVQKEIGQRDRCIMATVGREQLLTEGRKRGHNFLYGPGTERLHRTDQIGWKDHLLQYVHGQEIREGILLVLNWIKAGHHDDGMRTRISTTVGHGPAPWCCDLETWLSTRRLSDETADGISQTAPH